MPDVIIIPFRQPYAAGIKAVRQAVFTGEQGIDTRADFDGQDPQAHHVLISTGGEYVGTGRMLADGHIGRLAVLKPHRGKGLGARLVRALIGHARHLELARVYLGAQRQAQGFYEKLGFSVLGEPFMEVGIEHVLMEMRIA